MTTAGKALIPRERLALVEDLYLGGKHDTAIQRAVCAAFGVTARTARNYLARVKAKLAARCPPDPAAARARAEAMLLETYELARVGTERGPDTKTMAVVAGRLAQLHGADAPARHEVSGPAGGPLETVARVVLMPALEPDDDRGAVAAEPGSADPVPG